MTFDEMTVDQAKKSLEEVGHVRPCIHILLTTNKMMFFDYNGSDEELAKARETIVLIIKLARLAGQLRNAAFVSEAWISHRTQENPLWKLRASEDPEKKEGVFCMTWEGDERKVHFFELKRDNGKPELHEQPRYDHFKMWLDNAFDPLPPSLSDDTKWMAMQALEKMFPPRGQKQNQ
jgi:hypothetical protein